MLQNQSSVFAVKKADDFFGFNTFLSLAVGDIHMICRVQILFINTHINFS